MLEPRHVGVASVIPISQTQQVLSSAPAVIAWGQTSLTHALDGGYDHLCSGLHGHVGCGES